MALMSLAQARSGWQQSLVSVRDFLHSYTLPFNQGDPGVTGVNRRLYDWYMVGQSVFLMARNYGLSASDWSYVESLVEEYVGLVYTATQNGVDGYAGYRSFQFDAWDASQLADSQIAIAWLLIHRAWKLYGPTSIPESVAQAATEANALINKWWNVGAWLVIASDKLVLACTAFALLKQWDRFRYLWNQLLGRMELLSGDRFYLFNTPAPFSTDLSHAGRLGLLFSLTRIVKFPADLLHTLNSYEYHWRKVLAHTMDFTNGVTYWEYMDGTVTQYPGNPRSVTLQFGAIFGLAIQAPWDCAIWCSESLSGTNPAWIAYSLDLDTPVTEWQPTALYGRLMYYGALYDSLRRM